ncbi:MAG: hypothetical protein ACRCS8_03545 [Brevinema sp.]
MYLLIFLLLGFSPIFSEENTSRFDRFGMKVAPLSIGSALHTSTFPVSFYMANKNNYIISFGFDQNKSIIPYTTTNYCSDAHSSIISYRNFAREIGGHLGFGQLFPIQEINEYNDPLVHLGYLLEFSAGYVLDQNPIFNRNWYIGFNPQIILEYNMFLFTMGLYIDTSLFIAANVGFGFLLK